MSVSYKKLWKLLIDKDKLIASMRDLKLMRKNSLRPEAKRLVNCRSELRN